MSKSKKLVFFGNERLATAVHTKNPVLQGLIDDGYQICAIVSNFIPGKSRSARELEVAKVAEANSIPLLLPAKLSDIKDKLEGFGAEAAVLVAYGRIVPAELIDIFPRGIINIHPSLLPKYRGPTPVEQAILDGIERTGISLMKLAPKMDAGPIFAQQSFNLSVTETKQDLADSLLNLGAKLLLDNLAAILDGSLEPKDQNDEAATYTSLLHKSDGIIDWKLPAVQIERQIRAYDGFPKSRTEVFNQEVVILKVRIAKNKEDGDLVIKTGDGWLEIHKLIAPSGKTMSGTDYLRGYKK